MAGVRTFVVKFISDVQGALKGIKRVGDDLGGMGSKLASILPSFKTVAIAGTAAFGAVAASSFKLVQMASNLEESQSKVNTVFGDSAGIINEFADTSARTFGITKQAALEATGTFGALISAFGLGQGQASNMSVTLVQLAADLASFNNTNIEEAIGALRSGLSGETEPLKKYGVVLSDVLLKEKALEMGLYDGKGALDVKSKVQASYALILEQTAIQQGDVARTSEGFANQMKFLKASLSDAATELGTILLPYFQTFVTFLNDNIIPGVMAFAETLGEKGVGAAMVAGVAAMENFGITAVNVLEGAYVALLNFTHDLSKTVRILADAAALGFGLQGNIVGAGKSLAVAVAMSKVQDATNTALAGAGAMFDGFRAKVYAAQLQLAQMNRPAGGSADAMERLAGSVKKIVPVMTEAEKAAAALAAGLGAGGGGGGVAKAVKTASERLKEYTDALKSTNSAQKAFDKAQKESIKSGQSLTKANTDLATAQAALDKAVAGYGADSPQAKKAAKDLEQAQRGLERAGYNVEGSLFAIKDAEEALKKVRADPESTPQAIREAEIALAEAKLSSADAIDAQTEATDGLTKATSLLSDAVNGASIGSDIYKTLSDALTDAKKKQADASDAVAEAIDREAEALERYSDAFDKAGQLAIKYPKISAANPMSPFASGIPATVTGNAMSSLRPEQMSGGTTVVVQAGLVSSPDEIAEQISDLMSRRARLNGGDLTAFF
jgi:hypothetical protein